jgi:hypothetical protein
MALQFNIYFENNSKCVFIKAKKLELNKEQISYKCLLLFLSSKMLIILSPFQTVQITLRVLQDNEKGVHNSFPQAFSVNTLHLETYLLYS